MKSTPIGEHLMTRSIARDRQRVQKRLWVEPLEARDVPAVGGGFTNHGLDGVYYNDTTFTTSAFSRRDVRIDFDWGTTVKPGGSSSPGFRTIGTDNFSVRWTGQLIPRFSETYTFTGTASDTFKLELKPAGSLNWTTVVNQTADAAAFGGVMALQAGQVYDVRIEFKEFGGLASAKLQWQSPSTPREVIDPLAQSGMNNPDGSMTFADLVKGARNYWDNSGKDADGWPTGNGIYYYQESLNQGMALDPLMRGRITFSFKGKADISISGNVDVSSLTYSYDAATNTTTGSYMTRDTGANASAFSLQNSTRTGQPGGPGGITDLKLLRPVGPDAVSSYAPDVLFTTNMKEYVRHYTVVRHQLVANQQQNWSDRTLPSYFNQSMGSRTTGPHPISWDPTPTNDNGWSWEYKIMFANETGSDLMISIPTLASGRTVADTGSYVYKLAQLIKYGSDGVNPYTGPTANPVYPPLNPNLRVYLELENELWNWASVFGYDFHNINEEVKEELLANSADFQAINFDGLSTTPDGSGNYSSMDEWRYRYIFLRLAQISNIFRGVFGDADMPGTGSPDIRIRPVYEWQYDNTNDTARKALTWGDRYFNKADPASTYTGVARPVNYFLWGGGGATYYGANNGNGLTDLLPNSGFNSPSLPVGYNLTPNGSGWTFAGTAGIARDAGTGDDIPAPYDGNQVGYIAGTGRMTATFTAPTVQTSNIYGVAFKAHNRNKTGASAADTQNLRVYLDYGTPNQVDITAKTFSQGNGYTPPGMADISPWLARNVFWTESQYYYTKSFQLTPGSTHTITIVGTGAGDQIAFLEDVRVTSVDAIFDGGIPGGGEATGQPAGLNIRNTMNRAVSWATAYGLQHLAYEGGWSLGGDDGGSYVQLKAKYGDARTGLAQARFMEYYDQAGGLVNVFGTYAQLPSWSDFFAEQGLLNPGNYPIVQGIDLRANRLGAEPTNGSLAPAVLTRTAITLGDRADTANGRITSVGGWLSWNVIVPRSGTYNITVTSQAGGSLALLADEGLLATGTSGTDRSGSVYLTKGLHTLKVRSTSGAFSVDTVTLSAQGAPASPTIGVLNARNDAATLTWAPVTGAAGYVVLYGTAPNQYSDRVDVGAATAKSIGGLSNDTTYYFAVTAYGADGAESLPSVAKSVTALIEGQTGSLARWEFTGLVNGGATAPATAAASGAAAGVIVSPLSRGAGLYPAYDWMTYWHPDRFGSGAVGEVWALTLNDAITRNQYYQFSVSAPAGVSLGLTEMNLQVWFQDSGNANNQVAFRYSTDGVSFTPLSYSGTPNSAAGITIPLTSIPSPQNNQGTLTFRVYTFGSNSYFSTSIGMGTPADDILLRGTVRTTPNVEATVIGDGSAQRSMVGQVTVAFNTLVNVAPNAFTIQPLAGGSAVTVNWTTADVDGRTVATLQVPAGSLADGLWQLRTTAGAITHRAGGSAMTGDRVVEFFRLFGDIDGDRVVNGNDLHLFRFALGAAAGETAFLPWFDYDRDGVTNGTDFFQFRTRYGSNV